MLLPGAGDSRDGHADPAELEASRVENESCAMREVVDEEKLVEGHEKRIVDDGKAEPVHGAAARLRGT